MKRKLAEAIETYRDAERESLRLYRVTCGGRPHLECDTCPHGTECAATMDQANLEWEVLLDVSGLEERPCDHLFDVSEDYG